MKAMALEGEGKGNWRVSFDLIYARHPDHKLESWRQELKVLILQLHQIKL